jgi:hypothetical protein
LISKNKVDEAKEVMTKVMGFHSPLAEAHKAIILENVQAVEQALSQQQVC